MEILVPKYRYDGNEKVHSVYSGIVQGGRTVTSIVKPSLDRNRMEATKVYGPGLPRGQGGLIGVLVLGGMTTTLDEMKYIIEAKRAKGFVAQRGLGEIAAMCRLVQERRNEQIEARRKFLKANPSETPRKRPVRLLLPVGVRFVKTREPGLEVLARI